MSSPIIGPDMFAGSEQPVAMTVATALSQQALRIGMLEDRIDELMNRLDEQNAEIVDLKQKVRNHTGLINGLVRTTSRVEQSTDARYQELLAYISTNTQAFRTDEVKITALKQEAIEQNDCISSHGDAINEHATNIEDLREKLEYAELKIFSGKVESEARDREQEGKIIKLEQDIKDLNALVEKFCQ